jgi:hypothetical protein
MLLNGKLFPSAVSGGLQVAPPKKRKYRGKRKDGRSLPNERNGTLQSFND